MSVRALPQLTLLLLVLTTSTTATAGLSFEEMIVESAILEQRSDDEQALTERLAQERRAAEQAEEQERQRQREQEQERQRQEALRIAAQSPGERLTELRCLSCHGEEPIHEARYGLPGWYLTTLRMRHLHQAPLPAREFWPISRHLSAAYPAPLPRQLLEYLLLLLAPVVAIGLLLRARSRRAKAP